MIGLCFELAGHSTEHSEWFNLNSWCSLAVSFGVTDLSVMGSSPHLLKKFAFAGLNLHAIKNPARFRKSAKFDSFPIVQLITPKLAEVVDVKAESLPQFHHPEDAIYILGGEKKGSPENFIYDDNSCFLTIPTVHDRGKLWAQQAATVVLYDRWAKGTGS